MPGEDLVYPAARGKGNQRQRRGDQPPTGAGDGQAPEQQRRQLVNEVASLIIAGTLHAPVHATYDVTEIKQAAAAAASGGRSGKILIVPRR